mmetsp:Transcript_23921/g.40636  ORF Transcript_23921/g.40636 Transcript_23921/m.40636 type:complete len:219 (-) Transcript_23921:83-739(-)
MLVKIVLNQKQAQIYPKGGISWDCGYDTPQKFTITATAQTSADLGYYGLTQTLQTSTRVASYKTGGSYTILPPVGPPCLDGDDTMIPWYNAASKAQELKSIGDSITLTLEDGPFVTVPSQGIDPSKNRQDITQLEVNESFLVTLYKEQGAVKAQQWKWSYNYTLVPTNGSIYSKPTVTANNTTAMTDSNPPQNIVVTGPVATDPGKQIWAPAGWEAPP